METETYYLKKYEATKRDIWDDFVLNLSVNGTFLQTRRFLSYHADERFIDASYMLYDAKMHLVAVCPACKVNGDTGAPVLFSHKGSTFGGIIIHEKSYCAHKVIAIIKAFEDAFVAEGYRKIVYKITSDLFTKRECDLLEYCLYYCKYRNYDELNLYVDLRAYENDILSKFSQGKRTNVHNCEKEGIKVRQLNDDREVTQFHEILSDTLAKYELTPVHTAKELVLLKNQIIPRECEFYGAFLNEKMISGSMMFYFYGAETAHTQYLCADHEFDKLSPMTYMYYSMIVKMREKGFKKLSWGITSEHLGIELNYGLTRSKESFGSKYSVSKIYMKDLE